MTEQMSIRWFSWISPRPPREKLGKKKNSVKVSHVHFFFQFTAQCAGIRWRRQPFIFLLISLFLFFFWLHPFDFSRFFPDPQPQTLNGWRKKKHLEHEEGDICSRLNGTVSSSRLERRSSRQSPSLLYSQTSSLSTFCVFVGVRWSWVPIAFQVNRSSSVVSGLAFSRTSSNLTCSYLT